MYGGRPLYKNIGLFVFTISAYDITCKTICQKKIIMMETSIVNFNISFYIPSIQNLAFHLPYKSILRINHYGNTFREALKFCKANKDVLWCRDHVDRAVDSFSHRIKSEYYGGNISVFIEGIELEHFSGLTQREAT